MSRDAHSFESLGASADLGRRAAAGGVWMVGANGLRIASQTLATLVLARLLSPDDFGLVGMVAVTLNLLALMNDCGLGQATLQCTRITRAQVGNLFWVNLGMSLGLATLLYSSADAIAAFFGREELTSLVMFAAAGLLLEGIGLQHRALLARAMEHRALVAIDLAGHGLGIALGIGLAWRGVGCWALLSMTVTSSGARTLGYFLQSRWLPGFPRRNVGTGPLLRFGAGLLGFNALNFLTRNTDNVLVGRFAGAPALGFYERAYSLLMLPVNLINGPLTQVMVPTLSRLRDSPGKYNTTYLSATRMLVAVTFPIVGLLLVSTESVILLLLGKQWLPVTMLFWALGPAALVSAMNVTTGWLYLSTGTTGRQLRWTLLATPCTILCMVGGLPWGSLGVAIGVSFAYLALRVPFVFYTFRGTAVPPIHFLAVIARTLVPTLLAAAPLLAIRATGLSMPDPGLLSLAVNATAYLALYLGIDQMVSRDDALIRRMRDYAFALFRA